MNTIRSNRGCRENTTHLMPERWARSSEQMGILVLLGILNGGLAVAGCARGGAAIKLPDTEVLVAPPVQRDVPIHNEWVATLDGYVNAEIRPQVSGYIIKQNYKEGSFVRKGEVLFEIDPRPFQATLDQKKGELAQAEAELDLNWTKVTSLVDGVAGIADVQMGNLVSTSSHMTSVSQVNPIKVYFPISEQ